MIQSKLDTRYMSPRLIKATEDNEAIHRFSGRTLSFQEYEGATIYPGRDYKGTGGVVTKDGAFVPNTSVFNGCKQAGPDLSASVEHSDEIVVYLGMFHGCWGHCLTDSLQRLWVCGVDGMHPSMRNLKLVYTLTDWCRGLPDNFLALLAELGLAKENLFEVKVPTSFEKVIVPDSCFYNNVDIGHIEYTKEYVQLIDRLRVSSDNASRKVYFSRTRWGVGTYGEELFEDLFRRRGYEIVYPEKLSFDEQRKLLSQTVELVATEGSVAHNSIFMPKGSTVVIIRKAAYMNRWQPVINEMLDLAPVYIDANFSNLLFNRKFPTTGPFFLYVNSHMAKYLGCRAHFPIGLYLQYVRYFLTVKFQGLKRRLRR